MSDTLNVTEVFNGVEALLTEQKADEALQRLSSLSKDSLSAEESVSFYHLSGVALARLGRINESLVHFRKSLAQAESCGDVMGQARACEYIGSLLHQNSNLEEAKKSYQRALALYERCEDAAGQGRGHRNLGNLAVDSSNDTSALQEYEKSCAIFRTLDMPDEMAPAVIHRSSVLYSTKGLTEALKSYRQGIEEDKCCHYLVLNNYGFMLMLDGKIAEGMQFFDRSLADIQAKHVNDDDLALVCLNIGVGSALTDDYAKAEEYLRKAAALLEKYPQARAVEFLLQVNAKYRDQGVQPYLIVDNGQKLSLAHLNLAAVLAWTDRMEEAKAEIAKGIECDRDSAYPYLSAGWVYLAAGSEKDAATAFNRACGKEPSNEEFQKALNIVNPYINSKVGRNDPCPCGSGKKFKKCHGAL